MIDWRTLVVISVLGLLLAGYMARNGHARYVADLVVVCGAFFTRHPQLAIVGCAILIIVRHSGLVAGALATGMPDWLSVILLPGAHNMSSCSAAHKPLLESRESAISEQIDTAESSETERPIAENEAESFYFGETAAIARLVAAGVLGLTEGVKIGGAAKSGNKYQKRTKAVQAEVDRLTNRYPNRTQEQEAKRSILNP